MDWESSDVVRFDFGPLLIYLFIVVASFTEIKAGYRCLEMKQNAVFRMLVLFIENIIRGHT